VQSENTPEKAEQTVSTMDTTRREYQMKTWKKVLFGILGVFLLAMGSVFFLVRDASENVFALIPTLLIVAGGAYVFLFAWRGRLVIDGSRIEIRGAIQEKSADLSEIEGYRTVNTRNGSYYRIVLKDHRGSMTFSRDFDTDSSFNRWFQQIPNLDQSDRDAVLEEIQHNTELGSTPEERMGALASAKTISTFILIVTIAAALVLDFAGPEFRFPTAIVVAIAPMVVLFFTFRSPLLYTAFKPKADPRAEVVYTFFAAGFGLLIHAGSIHFVSAQSAAWMVILIALACVGALWGSFRGTMGIGGRVLGLLLFIGIYAYGLVVAADTMPDRSQASSFTTNVVSKHISSGRSTSYILVLAPWGPVERTNTVSVSSKTYRNTEIGDEVCLALHAGALHVPWYMQIRCGGEVSPDLVK